jgi:hypothetical protein
MFAEWATVADGPFRGCSESKEFCGGEKEEKGQLFHLNASNRKITYFSPSSGCTD